MKLCPHCRTQILSSMPPAAEAPITCPGCGRLLAEQELPHWTSIARLANLAETGYFADLLQGGGIPTNVVHHSEFDALEGGWRTLYVLQVPEQQATEAAETLKRELALAEDEASPDWRQAVDGSPRGSGSVWKPVALMLVAGGLAYCAGRSGLDRPPVSRPGHDELWKALSEPAGAVFTSDDGTTLRRLTTDPHDRSVFFLEEDCDRDGQWDRLLMFRQGELVADTVP